MDGETVTLSSSASDERKKSIGSVSILVVDDDTTCLSIVAAILKKFKYEVVTVKHPSDALCALRIRGGTFDLVVTDVHMPDMNGFDLQQAIAQEFHLPVVLMSADEEEEVAVKGLENGAAYFIMKPVSPDDLRDLWQFASMKKKSKVVIEETHEEESSTGKNDSNEIAVSAGSVSEGIMLNNKKSKRTNSRKEGSGAKKGENSQSSSQKRSKITWTNSLHNRFLEAIRSIGLDRAVPKRILEVMNVPGLTRENVASHLQKYRIFLRRVSDASYKVQHPGDLDGLSRNIGPTFESSGLANPSTLILNRLRQSQSSPSTHVAPLPNQASSSNLITQSRGFGQSRLLGSIIKPNIGNTNLIRESDRLTQNNYQTFTSTEGNLSNVFLGNLSSVMSTSIAMNPSGGYQVLPRGSIGISSIVTSMPLNFTYGTNYVGYSMSNVKRLAESGHSLNLSGDEVQPKVVVQGTTKANENINVDQLGHYVGGSSSFGANNNNGGGQLSDIVAAYNRVLPPSYPALGPIFGLSEFGILSTRQQSLEDTTLEAQVNIQNHTQENRGETITNSNLYGGMSHSGIAPSIVHAPNQEQFTIGLGNSQELCTHSQINERVFLPPNVEQVRPSLTLDFNPPPQLCKTLVSATDQRDDDDFLDSLLAPFGEDQSYEGI